MEIFERILKSPFTRCVCLAVALVSLGVPIVAGICIVVLFADWDTMLENAAKDTHNG